MRSTFKTRQIFNDYAKNDLNKTLDEQVLNLFLVESTDSEYSEPEWDEFDLLEWRHMSNCFRRWIISIQQFEIWITQIEYTIE